MTFLSVYAAALLILLGLMTLLWLLSVALLEQTLETRPGYKEYVARTSPFIPWPARR